MLSFRRAVDAHPDVLAQLGVVTLGPSMLIPSYPLSPFPYNRAFPNNFRDAGGVLHVILHPVSGGPGRCIVGQQLRPNLGREMLD